VKICLNNSSQTPKHTKPSCTLLEISIPYGVIDIPIRISLSRPYFDLSFVVPLLLLPRTSWLVSVEACNPVLQVSNPTIT